MPTFARTRARCPIFRAVRAERFRVCSMPSIPTQSRASTYVAATDGDDGPNRLRRSRAGRQTGGSRRCRPGPRARLRASLDGSRLVLCLTFTSTSANDGRSTPSITSSRRNAQVRARSGYWRRFRASCDDRLPGADARRALNAALHRLMVGLTVEPDGRRRVIFTWTPAPAPWSSRTSLRGGPTSWRSRSRRRQAGAVRRGVGGASGSPSTCARQRGVQTRPDGSIRSDHRAG